MSTSIEEERCLLRRGMNVVVVGELREGKEGGPIVLPFSYEQA